MAIATVAVSISISIISLRPALGWSQYTTPIENLYMIGASQSPGSGVNAFRAICLREIGRVGLKNAD